MIARSCRIAPALLALILVSATADAEIHKCRQGERMVYQELPCPAGSLSLAPPEVPPPPSAYEVEAARVRARNDIAEAEALRKREAIAAKAQGKRRAEASKQVTDCDRLLDRITQAEAKGKPVRGRKSTLKSDQRKYRRICGPL